MRGNDQDREAEAPEIVLSEALAEPQPVAEIMLWRGRGNVIGPVGVALHEMVGDPWTQSAVSWVFSCSVTKLTLRNCESLHFLTAALFIQAPLRLHLSCACQKIRVNKSRLRGELINACSLLVVEH